MDLSILYLEKNPLEARRFAKTTYEVACRLRRENDISEMPENHDDFQQFFSSCGIKWIRNFREWQEHDASLYQLIILDIHLNETKALEGWKLIENLRKYQCPLNRIQAEKANHKAPEVWVLSNLSHFRNLLFEQMHVDRYFQKSEEGYRRLKEELTCRYMPAEETSGHLTLKTLYGQIKQFPVDQILAIETVPRSEDALSRHQFHFLYLANRRGDEAIQIVLAADFALIKEVNQQLQDNGVKDLIQISRTAIINLKQITGIIRENRQLYVTIAQRNGVLYLVTRTYLKLMEDGLGLLD